MKPPPVAPAGAAPLAASATAVLDPADALAATHAANVHAGDGSLVGMTLAERYKVVKRLGEGGMGTVYEAVHTVLEKPVALKVLHPELARKQDLVDRFLQEAKAASRIRHENVIDISDFGAAEGHVYFAMELLGGHDLHEELTKARNAGKLLPWARTKHIFLQICSALSVAHERGIVHRDLKPENVYLVEFRGDPDFVKLLDFGIAKMTDLSGSEEGRKLTRTGMLFGTPEYMAPEQARGEPVDHRADIYAMGCILFLLVSNSLPFRADSFMGVLSQHLTEEPPEIAPETFEQIGAPIELADVIDRALEKDRDYRWQTIDDLTAAIYEACGEEPPTHHTKSKRAPSVDAPGETTRMRTPTDQQRARTPSGSGRLRSPTGQQRPRTPTGPARSKPPTSPPRTPEVSWIGTPSGKLPAAVIELGPVPEPQQKGHAFAIVSAIVVLGALGAAAYGLGWFERKSKPAAPTVSTTPAASGTTESAPVTPAAVPGETTPAPAHDLPEIAEIVIDSMPRGATILAVPDNTPVGKTPYTLTVVGSAVARHYKLSLSGYDDLALDIVPDRANIELKLRLARASATGADASSPSPSPSSTATPTPTTKPDTSTAVTKPDTSTAVTKPDTSTAVTKPDTSTAVTKPDAPALKPPPPPPDDPPESDEPTSE